MLQKIQTRRKTTRRIIAGLTFLIISAMSFALRAQNNDKGTTGKAAKTTVPATILSVSPVVLPAPRRIVDMQLRVTAPRTGTKLPVILLSHGHGRSNNLSSLNGNLPLAQYYAAQGFVVIQPTHLDSKTLDLGKENAGWPLFWRSRAEDMRFIIDQLETLEKLVPEIKGRLDKSRIAVVGNSMGGHTVSMLLGMQVKDPDTGEIVDLRDTRIKAGVMLTAPGGGRDGADLSAFANEHYPFFRYSNFATMKTNALIVWGDKDMAAATHLSNRGIDWFTDPYTMSPGTKAMLTIFGGEHLLGGISGYDAAETSDENPARVLFVQQMTTAYLRSALYPDNKSWAAAVKTVQESTQPLGKIETK